MTSFHFLQNVRKVVALVEKTFRGQTITKPIQIEAASYKADYVLIPKDQESQYLNVICERPIKILPSSIEFPPLLKEILIRQGKQTENITLKVRYNTSGIKNQRIAGEQETPTINFETNRLPTLHITTGDEQENRL